ncbi:MAG: hypothetical protein B6241_10220 [Spirochaetaceae bacterium 4572_59]|nr:MAG: hypothetical protein B6241_10220 [Spirochaetaceae bacterium 4572_59]
MKEVKLEMQHQALLFPLLKNIQIPLSEYCFANLYFFRNTHQYRVINRNEDLFLSGISYDKKRYLMPLQDLNESEEYRDELMNLGKESGYDMLFPIPEVWLAYFEENGFEIDHLEQDSDYLYTSEKMRSYSGRKLHKKRNLLKQFVENYDSDLQALTELNIHDPLELLDLWQTASTQEMCNSDYYQCRDALIHRDSFNLQGAVFYADGNAVGFMIGEAISDNVFAIHFAKGDTSAKGIYQFMFNRFTEKFCTAYEFINLEQDLGIEGLRKTKRSYLPDHMAHKYRIHLK